MKTKTAKMRIAILFVLTTFVTLRAQSQPTVFKAVLDGDYTQHQAPNYAVVKNRAPLDWVNFVAGQAGGSIDSGLNWNEQYGAGLFRNAAINGFDLVYTYDTGA